MLNAKDLKKMLRTGDVTVQSGLLARYLRVLMRQLRQKVEPKDSTHLLVTKPGIGYRLQVSS